MCYLGSFCFLPLAPNHSFLCEKSQKSNNEEIHTTGATSSIWIKVVQYDDSTEIQKRNR